MLLAFAGVASAASAQQTVTVTEYEVVQVQDKYQVITNPFWSNWFFSVGGGAQVLFGNNDHIGKFRDRIAPTLNVSVGKWVKHPVLACVCNTVDYNLKDSLLTNLQIM